MSREFLSPDEEAVVAALRQSKTTQYQEGVRAGLRYYNDIVTWVTGLESGWWTQEQLSRFVLQNLDRALKDFGFPCEGAQEQLDFYAAQHKQRFGTAYNEANT